jgi:hypothetical protein
MKRSCFIICLFILSLSALGQPGKGNVKINSMDTILFRDTVSKVQIDSLSHNLGVVLPANTTLVKYFKYTGTDTVFIDGTWTGDPHYICKYPEGPLISNKIYTITICFNLQGREGLFAKQMGFHLSNGTKVDFLFKGTVVYKN